MLNFPMNFCNLGGSTISMQLYSFWQLTVQIWAKNLHNAYIFFMIGCRSMETFFTDFYKCTILVCNYIGKTYGFFGGGTGC